MIYFNLSTIHPSELQSVSCLISEFEKMISDQLEGKPFPLIFENFSEIELEFKEGAAREKGTLIEFSEFSLLLMKI